MSIVRAKLIKLSVCECGHWLLKESIPLGTEYEVDPNKRLKLGMLCGGCHKMLRGLDCFYVYPSPTGSGGYLPAEAFELLP